MARSVLVFRLYRTLPPFLASASLSQGGGALLLGQIYWAPNAYVLYVFFWGAKIFARCLGLKDIVGDFYDIT